MKRKTSNLVSASLALLFTVASTLSPGVYAGNGNQVDKNQRSFFTPFSLVATVPAVMNSQGVDPVATDERAKAVSLAIGTFVATYDEAAILGTDVIQQGNWVLGGAEGIVTPESITAATLEIPTPELIDPTMPPSPANTRKVNILEICNRVYAGKALGVLPIVGDEKVANGFIHGTALPCEVAVYSDGEEIRIEMLDPEAIFVLFFTDVLFGPQMQNPAFAQEMQILPGQVKSEIRAILYAALDHSDIEYNARSKPLGPKFHSIQDAVESIAVSPYQSPYVHFSYTKTDGTTFSDADVAHVAETIIETLTVNGEPGAGIHDPALDAMLSPGSSWRAARPEALTLPGKIKVIEACSPLYAKQAMGTGAHHSTALPCEIALNTINGGSELLISYLDPNFMFTALFSDALNSMTAEEQAAFATLPPIVLADEQTFVQYALDNKLVNFALNPAVSVTYDMLPF